MKMEAFRPDGHNGVTRVADRRTQIQTIVLCALVALCDGYDTQAIAFVAPAISGEWQIRPSAFGPVFSAGLAGLAVGAFVFGPLADRFGRKFVILLCVALFGLASIGTVFSTETAHLVGWRALTGLGLGGVLPNIITLTSETASGDFRKVGVMLMICGFPLGATIAGFISAPLVAFSGWKGLLVLGGALPILLLPILADRLPGPMLQGGDRQAAACHGEAGAGVRGGALILLSGALRVPTLLLWTAFFCNLLVLYFLVNWLPSLLSLGGSSLSTATICTGVLNLGGIAGALAFSRLVERTGFMLVLAAAYVGCIGCLILVTRAASDTVMLMSGAALAGAIVIGGQMAMNAVAASFYPEHVRATGVGWALGCGRIGSILGPLAGSALIENGWRGTTPLLTAAGPLIVAAGALVVLHARQRGGHSAV